MYVGTVGVNVHTHFLVSLTNLENFSKENRMKLAAEVEFLPQEIWNKMRDELLVHLMAVAITRTLSFFPDASFLMSVLSQKQTHQGCVSGSAPTVPPLWSEALEPRVVHSTTAQGLGRRCRKPGGSLRFPSQPHLLSSCLPGGVMVGELNT